MAFIKTKSYQENKISNVERAIAGTLNSIREAKLDGNKRAEEAHGQYLITLRKTLKKDRADLNNFK